MPSVSLTNRLPSPATELAVPAQSKQKDNWSFERRRLRTMRLERSACCTSSRLPLLQRPYRLTSTSFGPLPCFHMDRGPHPSGELQLAGSGPRNAEPRLWSPALRSVTEKGAGDGKLQDTIAGRVPSMRRSSVNCSGGAAAARLAHNQEVVGSNPTPATSSGDGPGIQQPGSSGQGRARDLAMCPAVARNSFAGGADRSGEDRPSAGSQGPAGGHPQRSRSMPGSSATIERRVA